MMNVCFTVYFLATLGSLLGGINAVVDVDACQTANRFNCIFGTTPTAALCPDICNWCQSLQNFRKCQTSNRACLVSDRKKEPAYTTRQACEDAGLVWCGGDSQCECIQPEPVRELCFKKFGVDPCPNTHTTVVSCNNDAEGCFWCDEGRPERLSPNRCWKSPVDCSGDNCCKQAPCRRMFTETSCEARGCNYCEEMGQPYCNFGPPGPLPPTTAATTAVETTTATAAETTAATTVTAAATTTSAIVDVDDCQPKNRFNCMPGTTPTQATCPSFCNWCPSLKKNRRCQTSNCACLVLDTKKEPTFTTEADCEGAELVWCGGDSTQECIHPEPVRELCYKFRNVNPCPNTHTDEVSCNNDTEGCFWCDEGRPERLKKCWKLPGDCSEDCCCQEFPCLRNITSVASCVDKGCNYCFEDVGGQMTEFCNFGPPPPIIIP